MTDTVLTVLNLLDIDLKEHNALNIRCIGGRKGLNREITIPDLNRPMGAIMGFYEEFAHQRIQIIGRGEAACIRKMAAEGKTGTLEEMFAYQMPCCIFTHNLEPDESFFTMAEAAQCPVLQTDLSTSEFSIRLLRFLTNFFAPTETVHGVLVEIYGVGVLITGESGIGKSETALELLKHGHRLVADDVVTIHCVSGNSLIGFGESAKRAHHMEIRGLGIISIPHLFGVGAVRDRKEIQLVINLEEWDPNKSYSRLGTDDKFKEISNVKVLQLDIPVKAGRNIPSIIEIAVMNERLKKSGYNAPREFMQNILNWVERGASESIYFSNEDTI